MDHAVHLMLNMKFPASATTEDEINRKHSTSTCQDDENDRPRLVRSFWWWPMLKSCILAVNKIVQSGEYVMIASSVIDGSSEAIEGNPYPLIMTRNNF